MMRLSPELVSVSKLRKKVMK